MIFELASPLEGGLRMEMMLGGQLPPRYERQHVRHQKKETFVSENNTYSSTGSFVYAVQLPKTILLFHPSSRTRVIKGSLKHYIDIVEAWTHVSEMDIVELTRKVPILCFRISLYELTILNSWDRLNQTVEWPRVSAESNVLLRPMIRLTRDVYIPQAFTDADAANARRTHLRSVPITNDVGFCSANSMAQIPVPVPMSSTCRGD